MKKKVVALAVLAVILVIVEWYLFFGINSHKKSEVKTNESTNISSENVGEIYYKKIDEKHVEDITDEIAFMDNELLVVAEDASYSEVEKLASKYNAEIVGWIEITGDYQWLFSDEYTLEGLEDIAQQLENEKIISSATLNYISEISEEATREGFFYGEKWQSDLKNSSNAKGLSWGIEAINTFAAWDQLTGNNNTKAVRVGLIDNGFDENHEDLGFAEVFYNEGYDEDKYEEYYGKPGGSHGTHVAGTMAANANNNTGICGIYPYGNGNLYGVSIIGEYNYSENKLSEAAYKIAIAELVLRDVKVINISMGNDYAKKIEEKEDGYEETEKLLSQNAAILGDFLNRLLEKGYDFVIVAAAGNEGGYQAVNHSDLNAISREEFPNVFNRIIVVGSLGKKYTVSSFSCVGERVDIYAPGELIYSTVFNNNYENQFTYQDKTINWQGTSMAAPHVSGTAACVWAANNNLTGAQVKEIICSEETRNNRCKSVKMVDANLSVAQAIRTSADAEELNQNGTLYGWVVNQENEDKKIEKATVTVINTETNESIDANTDLSGHFEIILPEGSYSLSVKADGYETYTWPNGNANFENPITIKNQEVRYLDDWIKMTPSSSVTLAKVSMSVADGSAVITCDVNGDGTDDSISIEKIVAPGFGFSITYKGNQIYSVGYRDEVGYINGHSMGYNPIEASVVKENDIVYLFVELQGMDLDENITDAKDTLKFEFKDGGFVLVSSGTNNQQSKFIFFDSNSRYLKEEEISVLSSEELRIAINEIYARRGRKFDSGDLQSYFNSQSWYSGTIDPDNFDESILNTYEKANIDLMVKHRDGKITVGGDDPTTSDRSTEDSGFEKNLAEAIHQCSMLGSAGGTLKSGMGTKDLMVIAVKNNVSEMNPSALREAVDAAIAENSYLIFDDEGFAWESVKSDNDGIFENYSEIEAKMSGLDMSLDGQIMAGYNEVLEIPGAQEDWETLRNAIDVALEDYKMNY